MLPQIQLTERDVTRELILSSHNGILTAEDNRALDACISRASHLWICYIRGVPVCTWGLVPPTILSDRAYLWLYTTPAVEENKFIFVRASQLALEEMLELYPTIYGVTNPANRQSVRWLKWLGATFSEPIGDLMPFQIGAA